MFVRLSVRPCVCSSVVRVCARASTADRILAHAPSEKERERLNGDSGRRYVDPNNAVVVVTIATIVSARSKRPGCSIPARPCARARAHDIGYPPRARTEVCWLWEQERTQVRNSQRHFEKFGPTKNSLLFPRTPVRPPPLSPREVVNVRPCALRFVSRFLPRLTDCHQWCVVNFLD